MHRPSSRLVGVLTLVMSCAAPDESQLSQNMESLGIVKLVVEDTPEETVVIGLDEQGQERARLDLVHSVFELSPPFDEDYKDKTVKGRKLTIDVSGEVLAFETEGFEPLMQLPGRTSSFVALDQFMSAPEVREVLEAWKLGFAPPDFGQGGEEKFTTQGVLNGLNALNCSSQTTCGTAYNNLTINTCGAGAAANVAWRITHQTSAWAFDQHVVAQCCPATTATGVTSSPWFATKVCPTITDAAGVPVLTQCGAVSAGSACKACPAVGSATTNTNNSCAIAAVATNNVPGYGTATTLNWGFNWTFASKWDASPSGTGGDFFVNLPPVFTTNETVHIGTPSDGSTYDVHDINPAYPCQWTSGPYYQFNLNISSSLPTGVLAGCEIVRNGVESIFVKFQN